MGSDLAIGNASTKNTSNISTIGQGQIIQGKYCCADCLHVSSLLFNAEISEAVEFRNGLALHGVIGDQPIGIVGDGQGVSLEDNLMKLYPKCIAELNAINKIRVEEPNGYTYYWYLL